jgi:parallel beta helix pectate lyase-like protein
MFRLTSRAGRWPLAFFFAAVAALGACTDNEQSVTAPFSRPNKPSLAVGDVITVTNTKGTKEAGSLRWAVAQATGGEVIRFDSKIAGTTITLDSTLVISNYVTIEGPADKGITISGGGKGRVIEVSKMTLGMPATKLLNVSITGGKLVDGGGAGIRAWSPLTLEHSTVWGNDAVGPAAILGIEYGQLTLVNSTVSGNTSSGGYAAIVAGAFATIVNSTIAYNTYSGIYVPYLSAVTLSNSIIANNGFGGNCSFDDNVTYSGMNLSNDVTCGDETQMLIADPKLDVLRNNGGPSMTHALSLQSPAFNAFPAGCGVAVDQRYTPRDAYCDLGAFESTDSVTASLTVDRVANMGFNGSSALVTGTVKCNRTGDSFNVQVQVQQKSADKTIVSGTGTVAVTCTTVAQPWTVLVYPSASAFKSGGASATATTQQTPSWVMPGKTSRNIKLVAPSI